MQAHSLEEALAHPQQITQLILNDQGLEHIPAKVWKKLPRLQQLDLSHNQIKKIPAGLAQLTELRRLNLSFNRITRIEDDFFGLFPDLRHLDLRSNRLRRINVVSLSLETLDISENKLKGRHAVELHCPFLLHLDINNNKLEAFEPNEESLPQLNYLNLSRNRLVQLSLPSPSLYALVLNRNKLTSLPVGMLDLPRLRRLELSHNPLALQLLDIPRENQLHYVDVRRNPTEWPGVSALLLHLPHLRHLYGGLSGKVAKALQHFLRDVPPNDNPQQRLVFYHLWQGYAPGNVPASTLWACLRVSVHPQIQQGAQRELLRKYPARNGQLRSRTWLLYGATHTPRSTLVARLRQQNVVTTNDPQKAQGVILGYEYKEAPHPPVKDLPLMEERQLLHWLDQQEGRYLTHAKDRITLANLERLLKAPDPQTFRMGLGILQNNGTPDAAIDILLARWLNAAPAERVVWEGLFLPYLPGSLQLVLPKLDHLYQVPRVRGKAARWWKLLQL